MDVKRIQDGTTTTFQLEGRLDTITAPTLQEELIPEFETAKSIVLDFAALTYVSSAGLRVLLMGEKTANTKGAAMSIKNASEDIMDVFKMTGFDNILTFE